LAVVVGGEAVNKICVAAAFIWLARAFDPAVYGEVEWALSVTMVATLAADAGLTIWVSSEVARSREGAPALVARVGWLRLVLVLIAYALLALVAWTRGGAAGQALAIFGLTLFLTPFSLQYFFNGCFEPRWTALGQVVRGATFLIFVALLTRTERTASAVAVADVLGATVQGLCYVTVLWLVFKVRVRFRDGCRGVWALLSRSWAVGASAAVWGVHWYVGPILLGYLTTAQEVAWYSASLRLVLALYMMVGLYFDVLLPNLARDLKGAEAMWVLKMEGGMSVAMWAGCGVALAGMLAAHDVLTIIFGAPFAAAAHTLQIIVWTIPIAWLSGHLRFSLLAVHQQRKDYHAALVGTGVTILFSLCLIPLYHGTGAALALLAGTSANAVAAFVFARAALPAFALWPSIRPGVYCGIGCLVLGAILVPLMGETAARMSSAVLFVVCALVAERKRVDVVLRACRRPRSMWVRS
jgi:O-antigen/teichoic acid export membrane protein